MRDGDYQQRIDRLVELRKARAALDAREARSLHALVTDPPRIYPVVDPEGLHPKTTAAVEERVLKRAAEQTPPQFKA